MDLDLPLVFVADERHIHARTKRQDRSLAKRPSIRHGLQLYAMNYP